ncbi:MarR family transcriptional regulator [Actinospica durhamensis]|uniref:MarR family transcriptional regulator n=1 Tax=Actinospica durhamensis TaxID=1508375 RepID=A0A941ES33_9ACTN|nr:MarR family transcriptional regulator [Actinospica durhamensis]MBR7835473.1 MarR family transcriptional regulator [Actinospica durhamensis]
MRMKAMADPAGAALVDLAPAVPPAQVPAAPAPDAAEGARDEHTRRAWDRLRTLVYDDNRRGEVSATLGLSFVKVKALRRLLVRPMSMRELALELATDKPYVTQIVDALAERGLVVRTVDEHDRRCRIATLTEAGREAAARSEEILTRPPAGLSRLSERDLAELNRILDTLTGADD